MTTLEFGQEILELRVVLQGDSDQAFVLDISNSTGDVIDLNEVIADIVFENTAIPPWRGSLEGSRYIWRKTNLDMAVLKSNRYRAHLRISRGNVQTVWARGNVEVVR